MLLGMCAQQKLKQKVWTREKWAALGDWGHGAGGGEACKSTEMKGLGGGQGLADLEVKVTATLSIMCDGDPEECLPTEE